MKDRIDRAVATLRGYCCKVVDCHKCRLSQDGNCPFQGELPPCDWGMDERRPKEDG